MSLSALCDSSCTRCSLHERAKTVCVPGRGAESNIRLLIIGEAPGPQEDKDGLPFVGPSGALLEELIEEAGLDKQYIRYENVIRCIPTKRGEQGVRPPEPQEIEACLSYLSQIVRKIVEEGSKPLLIATGNSALQALTGFAQITRNRGKFLPLKAGMEDLNLTVMGMIHPAAVLRGQEAYRPLIAQDLAAAWVYGGETTSIDYSGEYVWMASLEGFRSWVEAVIQDFQAGKIKWVSFDTETTGFSPYDSSQRLVCFSFCAYPGKAIVVPLFHKDSPWKDDPISIKEIREITARLFSIVPLCGWNLSFDLKWVKLHMDLSPAVLYDGFLGSRWLYGSKRPAHDLNTLADQILGFRGHGHAVKVEIAAIKETPKRHYGNLSRETLLQYAGGDTDAALQLCEADRQRMQSATLTDGTTMLDKFSFVQMRALPTLVKMEMSGVKVSREINDYLKVEYVKMMKPLEDRVSLSSWGQRAAKILQEQRFRKIEESGKKLKLPPDLEVNLKSVDYVRCLLFDAMGFTVEDTGLKKLPKTGPPTAKQAIDALIERCSADERYFGKREILEGLREWKLLKHNYNNFIKNAENYIFDDGCFHTQFNIAGAETGRMSTYQPSLHGTPKFSMVRWQFVSRWQGEGGLIVSADASQMEIRVLAILSGDENLAATLESGLDLHTANASKMFRVPFDRVSKALRQRAKVAGFAIIYGATATTVSAQIKSSLAEAEEVIASWYRAYPRTREFQVREWRQAKKYGHTYTPFGRIRWLEGIKEAREGSHVWRQALNTAIQSVASDLVLLAIIKIVKEIEDRQLQSLPFGFIHDAVVSDVRPGELWDILEIKKRRMETYLMQAFPWITVPIVAEFDICPGWGFPCEVKSFTDTEIHLAGPSPHMALLARETTHLGGVSYETMDRWKDDRGQEHVKAVLRRTA